MSIHKDLTGDRAIHPATYVQSSDPGAVGNDKLWIDTTTGSTFATGWLLKIRASANTVWTTILDLATSLGLKANLASPTFTGTPAAPTASAGTNTTQLATTAFVKTAVDNLIAAAPGALDTLDELAAALGDDANFAATMTTSLAAKAPLASPTFTGTPAAPTAATSTNTTQLATTAFVQQEISAGGAVVANDSITNAKLRDSSGLSVIGRSANSTGDPADIVAANDGEVLRRSGTAVGFGSIPVASVTNGAATTGHLGQFAATTSAQLAGVVSDETGSGALVFGTAPTLSSPVVGTQTAGDNSTKAASTAYADNAVAKQPEVLMFAVTDETTAITTGTAKLTFRMPFAMTLTSVRANLNTSSSSGNPAIDINEGGASIFSTTLTIDSGEKTSTTAATAAVLSDTSLADDAEMTVDIDTAGTGAKGLKITLIGTRT